VNCVILQPSYIPWRGYFHQILKADCFVFLDDVQYDHRGWRNRNRIKTPHGTKWLTIPVYNKGSQPNGTRIQDIRICYDTPWNTKHWHALKQSYARAPFFEQYAPLLEELYSRRWESLCDLTIESTISLARELGIRHTQFLRSSSFHGEGVKTDRLLSVLTRMGATHYISGPAAKEYLEEEKFRAAGITLEYMEYRYPEYPQLYPPFDGQVSVLDLLFMTGPEALSYIKAPPTTVLMDGQSAELASKEAA
jgi:hypothetical protein